LAGVGLGTANVASAGSRYTEGVEVTGAMHVGSTLKFASEFSAPRSGRFVVDTEIYTSDGKWVTQFDEELDLRKSKSITRWYDWNTSGIAAGSYVVKQGLFTSGWQREIEWNNRAGGFELKGSASAPTTTAKPNTTTSTAKPSTTTTAKPGTTTTTAKPSTTTAKPSAGVDLSDPVKKEAAMQLVSSAENSSLNWKAQYGYIENIGDGRGYTGGIIGFTSGTHDMLELVRHYKTIAPNNVLVKWIPALENVDGTSSTAGLGTAYMNDWRTAATDPKLIQAQNEERDRVYFNPALKQAKADGLGVLGQFIYYDAIVVHGYGWSQGYDVIRTNAMKKAKTPAQGGNETTYLNTFLDERNKIMKMEEAHSDVSRIETAQRVFLKNGNLNLDLPLSWSVYGDKFSITKITL
jgi:chitosanase